MTWKRDQITKFTPKQQKYCKELFKNAQNDTPYPPVRKLRSRTRPGAGRVAALGRAFAINVNNGDVTWRIPFGRVESLENIGVNNTGSYNIGVP